MFCSIFVLVAGHTVGWKKLSAALQSEESLSRVPEANTNVVWICTESDRVERHHTYAQVTSCFPSTAEQW
jgi:hypothetical protein